MKPMPPAPPQTEQNPADDLFSWHTADLHVPAVHGNIAGITQHEAAAVGNEAGQLYAACPCTPVLQVLFRKRLIVNINSSVLSDVHYAARPGDQPFDQNFVMVLKSNDIPLFPRLAFDYCHKISLFQRGRHGTSINPQHRQEERSRQNCGGHRRKQDIERYFLLFPVLFLAVRLLFSAFLLSFLLFFLLLLLSHLLLHRLIRLLPPRIAPARSSSAVPIV